MARWRVAQGHQQFTAEDLAELQRFARQGKIGPGDLIQPPGASDWLYAQELPDLLQHLREAPPGMDLDARPRRGGSGLIIALLLLGIAGAGYGIYHATQQIPEADDLDFLKRLQLTEMLVTADPAPVLGQPQDGASSVGSATKDSKVQLVAKRGPWYRIVTATGVEGWVKVDEVVPAYLFAGAEARQNHDPIYNPDRYLEVKNASWMQLPDQRRNNVTVFQFLLENESRFEMTDVKLLITIRDSRGNVLETKEIGIEGIVPSRSETMVGTLSPDPRNKQDLPRLMTDVSFLELQKQDPDLALRWSAGIEVQMESKDFEKANVDLLEIRAIPKAVEEK